MKKKRFQFLLNKTKRKTFRLLPFFKGVLGALVILVLFFIFKLTLRDFSKVTTGLKKSGLPMITKNVELKNNDGRTNILLLGIESRKGGENLTDSLIFVSLNSEKSEVLLLSIPRDLWVPSIKAKINTAYHYGEEKKEGGGLILAKASVEETLGQVVHYAFCLDFSGFENAVDLLGGVEVEVERTFDDYKYPIPGKENAYPESSRYEHLHFEAGKQTMSGERALKYVRSRYAQGPEGSDFARSARQQRFLLAFKKALLSKETLLNPQKMIDLMKTFGDSIDTDISVEVYPDFLKLFLRVKEGEIKKMVLNSGEGGNGGILYESNLEEYDNQFVLMPKNDDWGAVKNYVNKLLK